MPSTIHLDHCADTAVATLLVSAGPARDVSRMLSIDFALTPRQCQVALMLLAGMSPHEIALRLETSVETARSHVKQVLHKTGHSRVTSFIRTFGRAMRFTSDVTGD